MSEKVIKQSAIDSLALEIMDECKKDGECVTFEEAQEMAVMEIKARDIKRYEKSDTPRKKNVRERKIDFEKKEIFLFLQDELLKHVQNLVGKNESEFTFDFKENSYSVKIIKHRPPKN